MVKIRKISLYCRSWNTDHGPRVKRVCKKIMAQFRMILKNRGSQQGSQGGRGVSQVSAFHGNNVAMAIILPQLTKIQGNFATFATPCDPLPTGGCRRLFVNSTNAYRSIFGFCDTLQFFLVKRVEKIKIAI